MIDISSCLCKPKRARSDGIGWAFFFCICFGRYVYIYLLINSPKISIWKWLIVIFGQSSSPTISIILIYWSLKNVVFIPRLPCPGVLIGPLRCFCCSFFLFPFSASRKYRFAIRNIHQIENEMLTKWLLYMNHTRARKRKHTAAHKHGYKREWGSFDWSFHSWQRRTTGETSQRRRWRMHRAGGIASESVCMDGEWGADDGGGGVDDDDNGNPADNTLRTLRIKTANKNPNYERFIWEICV